MHRYHNLTIGGSVYPVCDDCGVVNMANFECPNCRMAMRATGNPGLIEIADIIDQRQGIFSKDESLKCPSCKNSEINFGDKFCKICELPISNH
jgi:hypothetical protein